jgi:hypothetical protein
MVKGLGGHLEIEGEREMWVMYISTNRTQKNRQNSLSPTVNRIATTRNTTVSIKKQIHLPSSFQAPSI